MTHRHKPERACQQGKDGWTQDEEGEYGSDSERTLPWRHASSSMELPNSPPDCKELTGTNPTAQWEKESPCSICCHRSWYKPTCKIALYIRKTNMGPLFENWRIL